MKYHSILAPLDGSPFSEQALPPAFAVARQCDATVHLALVHQVEAAPVRVNGELVFDAEADAQRRRHERAYLDRLAEFAHRSSDIVVKAALIEESSAARRENASPLVATRDGRVAASLSVYAQQQAVDLVVMATHGRGVLARYWLGNVAGQVTKGSPAPVLLVRPIEAAPDSLLPPPVLNIGHILLPLDGSPLAEEIIVHAAALGCLTDATYTLLRVVEPSALSYTPIDQLDWRTIGDQYAVAQEYIDQVADRMRLTGLHVRTAVVVGEPARAILSYARWEKADLIAMATHGRSGLRRILMGSVTDAVVHDALVPILVHRPHLATQAPYADSMPAAHDNKCTE